MTSNHSTADSRSDAPENSAEAELTRGSGLLLIVAVTCALWAVNTFWLMRDTRPPVWDMAMHQAYALNYLPGASLPSNVSPWERSGNYPPFVHLVIAAFFILLHPGPHVAVLANIPATLLLFFGLYELARLLSGDRAARWACLLTALTPYVIWISRETVLDYWLAAWVAISLVLLIRTDGFRARHISLLLGLAWAFGLLTKWLFAGFMVFPTLYVVMRNRLWKSHRYLVNFIDAVLVAFAVAGVWYLPNLPRLIRYFSDNARIGAREGEPPVLSLQSLIYYLRLLEGYQLFGLLFCFLILSGCFVLRKHRLKDGMFLAVSIAGGWLVMTCLRTKDPRFTLPLLGPMMVIAGAWIQSWQPGWRSRSAKVALLVTLAVQAYAANFGIPWLPEQVVLAKGYEGSLSWDWNLYSQHYFHILGAPRREDWKQDAILARVAQDIRANHVPPTLALVPDLPRFNAANFQLYARLRRYPFRVDHPQSAAGRLRAFDGFNYVVMTERLQGMPWSTRESAELNQTIVDEHQVFRLLEVFNLPNGDAARLYAIRREGN